jgi:hypothetical protein
MMVATVTDSATRRRRAIITAVIVALIALGFYVGFFITMALR